MQLINNDKIANGFQIQPLFDLGDTIIMANCAFHHSNMVNNYLPQLLLQTGVVLYNKNKKNKVQILIRKIINANNMNSYKKLYNFNEYIHNA
jgi:hypothetical protein